MSGRRWTRTDHSLALELVQKIDHRQVMAIDRYAGDGAPPFFLHEGQADLIRDDVRNGRFLCPLEACTSRVFHFSRGGDRRHHFVHEHAPTVHDAASLQTALAVDLLAAWFRNQDCDVVPVDVRQDDAFGALLVERAGPTPVPLTRVLIAWGPLEQRDVHALTAETWDEGFEVMWFVGVPSTMAKHPADMDGSVMLLRDATRAIQDLGAPFWLFNPTREWGLGAVEPDPDLHGGMIRVRALPLWSCELSADGLVPPPPDDPVVRRLGQQESVRQARLARSTTRKRRDASSRPKTKSRRRGSGQADSGSDASGLWATGHLLGRSIRRVVTVGAPDHARAVLAEEVHPPVAIEHSRFDLRGLPQLQAEDTLLLVFGSADRLRFAERVLRPLLHTTALLPLESPFTYRELNEVIDLLR